MNQRGMSPQRPPRRRSNSKGRSSDDAAAGMLVSVVRTLTTSTSEEQRELEKKRLELGYKDTEKTVDTLIAVHKDDLTTCLSTFRKLSTDVSDARERVRNVKNNLYSCKTLLQCRRDELRKLWTESAEQRFVLQYLQKIEEMRSLSHAVDDAVEKKHYLHAAQILRDGLDCLENDLSDVEGLRELKSDLRSKKQEVYSLIVEELTKQLYLKPSEELFTQLRGLRGPARSGPANSQSGAPGSTAASAPAPSVTNMSIGELDLPAVTSLLELDDELGHGSLKVSLQDSPILQDNGMAYEDPQDAKPDAQPVQYMAVLSEALNLLDELISATDAVKTGIQKGLLKVVNHTTYFVIDYLSLSSLGTGDSRHLAELLGLLFRQFKIIATLHSLLIDQFKRVSGGKASTIENIYSVADVWKCIQTTINCCLNDYLDVKSTVQNIIPEAVSISSYFTRPSRMPTTKPAKKTVLFRFDATSYAINLAEYTRDKALSAPPTLTTPRTTDSGETLYVCPRKPDNIIIAFKPLMKLVKDIETSSYSTGTCVLRQYLESYTKDTYLVKVRHDVDNALLTNLSSGDAWSNLTSAEETKRLESSVHLLTSSVKLMDTCRQLTVLMNAIPTFSEQIAESWLQLLQGYHHAVREKYETFTKSLIKQEGTTNEIEWRKISAAWAVDEDISRLLKSLPNWVNLMDATRGTLTPGTPFSPVAHPTTPKGHLVHQESTAEIRSRNTRESQILISNLGMVKKIEDWEIISDINLLKFTANMHESIGYFCASIRRLLSELPAFLQNRLRKVTAVREKANLSRTFTDMDDQSHHRNQSTATSLADEFEAHLLALDDMAATCLLMLHLEIRVQSFYYLLPIAKQTSHMLGGYQSQDVDAQVLSFNRKLAQLDEVLRLNLMPMKVRYIFEGLGHLVSAIFILSAQHIAKINDNGKKRMGRNILAIQACLSGLTSTRESDLDHARKYFDLLYRSPEQILDGIPEQAGEFSETEYYHLLALAIRSHPVYSTEPGALEQRQARLRQIMSKM